MITGRKPAILYDRSTGYGIVRFHKPERTITMECWPRYADPATDGQYAGWPITIQQEDNYSRLAVAWLPTLKVTGAADPVVQVIDEADGELVYALRIKGSSWRPKVFGEGRYTIKVSLPESGQEIIFEHVPAMPESRTDTLEFTF